MNHIVTTLLDGFLAREGKRIPGTLIYAKVWGSHSHGTQLPTSDVDYAAVYQLPTYDVVALSPGPETVEGKGPDFQSHELAKFCRLLLKGNPGIVEMLFTEEMEYRTPVWELLRAKRDAFLNQQTLKQYIGYCNGQLQRLDSGTRLHTRGGEYNTKWAYHLIRIALDAERIANGQPPVVMKSGDELALLMNIRAGKFSPEQVSQRYTEIKARIEKTKHRLPESADIRMLNDWLWKRRLEYLD